MNQYGYEEFKISYYENAFVGWVDVEGSFEKYSSNYTYKIEDEIKLKNLDGDRVNLLKGYHHKFEIEYHVVDADLYDTLMLAQTKSVRFYPHKEVDKYYTVNITLVKPTYHKNNVYIDLLKVVMETNDYQDLINARTQRTIVEAFHFGDNTVGLNGGSYTASSKGVTSVSGGKFGNCINITAGSFLAYENTKPTAGTTLSVWCKLPYSDSKGEILYIGDDGFTLPVMRISKKGSNNDDTVNISITFNDNESSETNEITLNENEWFLITIQIRESSIYSWINDTFWYAEATQESPDFIYLGIGINYSEDFDTKWDEMIQTDYFDTVSNGANQVAYWYNNNLGRSFTNTKYWY